MKRVSLVLKGSASLYPHHFLFERQLIAQYGCGVGGMSMDGQMRYYKHSQRPAEGDMVEMNDVSVEDGSLLESNRSRNDVSAGVKRSGAPKATKAPRGGRLYQETTV
jgi:hypothetical protein